MMPRGLRLAALLSASVLVAAWGRQLDQQRQAQPFPHARHAQLFVNCTTCHAGIVTAGAPVFPAATACASCHDGKTERAVNWQPRPGPRVSNLRFDHLAHAVARRQRGDTASACADCHADAGARWMQVRGPSAPQCVTCHTQGRFDHLTQPDTACATCHVPLARATALPAAAIAKFPAPATHRAADFLTAAGHGAQAKGSASGAPVATSCATCHARDFCAACHVNAPETRAIQALEPDPRSLVLKHELVAPPSHAAGDFGSNHGHLAGKTGTACATCHTQESCRTCHSQQAPRPALALPHAGPGRAVGAVTVREEPASHGPGWDTHHGSVASATMQKCVSCHTRESCLTCHQPDPARKGSYHPAAYLTRHPADAYTRGSSCADCHNTGEFCQTCHQQAGLSVKRALIGVGSYHDGNRQFALGHGQAARQSLESCVSCHVERDCLTCHSVVGGRGFNPHGPGFDPERMLRKNPQLCMACHGRAIPGVK
jgi:hypothetical protein